jgi:ribosomal protein S18 acetylase RimI-like enzyme
MPIEAKILGPHDASVLATVAPGVFDRPVNPRLAAEFLSDPRHHIAVVIDDRVVVGFASAVHYIHPDKPPELWLNEVAVAPSHRRRGLAKLLLHSLFDLGLQLGCEQAWVLSDPTNDAALRLYASVANDPTPKRQMMFSFRLSSLS